MSDIIKDIQKAVEGLEVDHCFLSEGQQMGSYSGDLPAIKARIISTDFSSDKKTATFTVEIKAYAKYSDNLEENCQENKVQVDTLLAIACFLESADLCYSLGSTYPVTNSLAPKSQYCNLQSSVRATFIKPVNKLDWAKFFKPECIGEKENWKRRITGKK